MLLSVDGYAFPTYFYKHRWMILTSKTKSLQFLYNYSTQINIPIESSEYKESYCIVLNFRIIVLYLNVTYDNQETNHFHIDIRSRYRAGTQISYMISMLLQNQIYDIFNIFTDLIMNNNESQIANMKCHDTL